MFRSKSDRHVLYESTMEGERVMGGLSDADDENVDVSEDFGDSKWFIFCAFVGPTWQVYWYIYVKASDRRKEHVTVTSCTTVERVVHCMAP